MSETLDVIILGGGPGGYVAAIRATQLGLSTALVEREALGGVCLNWGCIPTKSLLHAADLLRQARHASDFGLNFEGVSFDTKRVVARSRKVAAQLSGGIAQLMKKNGVRVIEGTGRLEGSGRVVVETPDGSTTTLESDAIVLATGSRPRSLAGIESNGKQIWTAREAMVPKKIPDSLLVIGSGAIGIEFASFYSAFGSDVTIVEVLPTILPNEDAEISALARKAFEREGIQIWTGAEVKELKTSKKGVKAVLETIEGSHDQSFEKVIVSVGVTGNVEDVGLETTAVKIDRGFILTDANGETNEPGIYAIGDVAGPPCLAHKATHEGTRVAEHIAGEDIRAIHPERIPGCTYSSPQIASIGLSEAAALDAGHSIRVGRFPLAGNGKAIAVGQSGLVKTIFEASTGQLIGAHMIGPEVTEMIQGFAIAMSLEATEAELIETVFPHPTISEAMHESVLAAFDRALHI
jgi:dihydrolipoamide dehydrogenase